MCLPFMETEEVLTYLHRRPLDILEPDEYIANSYTIFLRYILILSNHFRQVNLNFTQLNYYQHRFNIPILSVFK
jgi:hypothetical protein